MHICMYNRYVYLSFASLYVFLYACTTDICVNATSSYCFEELGSHLRSKCYFCRKIFIIKKLLKNLPPQYNFFVCVQSINIPNLQQNNIQNEIEQIIKEIDLMQIDRLTKNEKSQNQFKIGLMQIKRIQVKKDKGRIFFKPKKYKI